MVIRDRLRYYTPQDTAARFLLGGIGTGTVSIDSRAHLCDWELTNVPQKGFTPPYSFFALNTAPIGADGTRGESCSLVLEGELQPPFDGSHGLPAWEYGGLPRMTEAEMHARYPFVYHRLSREDLPLTVSLESFTPFIPLDADRSGLPAAVMTWRVTNEDRMPRDVTVSGSLANTTLYTFTDSFKKPHFEPEQYNVAVEEDGFCGVHCLQSKYGPEALPYMETGLMLADPEAAEGVRCFPATVRPYWAEGQWWDGVQDYWNDLGDGELEVEADVPQLRDAIHASPFKIGAVARRVRLAPGATATWRFILAWYRPNRRKGWLQTGPVTAPDKTESKVPGARPFIRNAYARWGTPPDVTRYLLDEWQTLHGLSSRFADSLYASTMPEPVIDAVASTLTVLRSTTCFRVEGGRFFAFEGSADDEGACHGNCAHVWNYAQTLAYLFPELQRSMSRTELIEETDDEGAMAFRAQTWLDGWRWEYKPASDGALGAVMRAYREWRLSGDLSYLRDVWPGIRRILAYARRVWDPDGDGVLEGVQHNTYDIDFHGVSTLPNSIWLGALRAAEAMATALGETERAEAYRAQFRKSAERLDALCYQGEYYMQNRTVGARSTPDDTLKYQYDRGVLADQLLGQTWAYQQGLGDLLPASHIRSAASAIMTHNFRSSFRDVTNLQRTYAVGDDAGLLLCSWPSGDRPAIPFVYSDEVWSGVEYSVASLLVYQGKIDDALRIVEAVRARHDGRKRSPWDEAECGHHYARSLASYGVWVALTGFLPNLSEGTLTFRPVWEADDHHSFFCCAAGWGMYHRTRDPETGKVRERLEVLYGDPDAVRLAADPEADLEGCG